MPMHDGATRTCKHCLSYFKIIAVVGRFYIQRDYITKNWIRSMYGNSVWLN